MNQDEYMRDRVDSQLAWYSKKSAACQRAHKTLKMTEIIAAAAIAFIAGTLGTFPLAHWVVGGLGILIAIAAGASSLFQYQENWINYRATLESLKQEKFLFLTGVGDYAMPDAFARFVARFENLIASGNSQWVEHTKSAAKVQS